MKSIRLSCGLILLLFLSCASFAQETASIKGKVHVEKGSPAGVAVILSQGEREVMRGTTDKHGEFAIAKIPTGIYNITFRKPGLATSSIENFDLRNGKTRSLNDIRMPIDEGSIAFIRGSVFTERGRSVPGVRVELARVVGENSTEKIDARVTGETGEFVFRLPPESAKYRLTLKGEGIETATKDVQIDSAAVYRVALTAKPVPK